MKSSATQISPQGCDFTIKGSRDRIEKSFWFYRLQSILLFSVKYFHCVNVENE